MNTIKNFFKRDLPFFLTAPAIIWEVVFLVLPLFFIIIYSLFFVNEQWQMFPTVANYLALLNFAHIRIIFRSLFLALLTATITLCMSYPVAYYLALYAGQFKSFLIFLLTLPFFTSSLVQIHAWFYLLEHNGLINQFFSLLPINSQPSSLATSQFGILIVMCYCYLPFMVTSLYASLSKLDVRLLEASADLGATPLQTFRYITIPLSLSGIKTGILLVLVPAFGEFAIPSLAGGNKAMYVGSLISYYFVVARNNGLGAAFTIMCGITLILVSLLVQHSIDTKVLAEVTHE